MSRTQRLLDLVQVLRRHRRPVSGRKLAAELGVSIRTLYRDIVTLQGQGAPIEGEPGLGYILKPGFMLPPLTTVRQDLVTLGRLGVERLLAWIDGAEPGDPVRQPPELVVRASTAPPA